jgi:hypothetical protein
MGSRASLDFVRKVEASYSYRKSKLDFLDFKPIA